MIYFVQQEKTQLVKIGYAENIQKRFKELKKSLPDLKILTTIEGDYKVEKKLHETFRHLMNHGEWFTPGPDLMNFIKNSTPVSVVKPHYYLPSSAAEAIKNLGALIRSARTRRGWPLADLSSKVGVSCVTLIALEKGNKKVRIGILMSVMWMLGLEKEIQLLFNPIDHEGYKLMDSRLPKRVRKSKKLDNNF